MLCDYPRSARGYERPGANQSWQMEWTPQRIGVRWMLCRREEERIVRKLGLRDGSGDLARRHPIIDFHVHPGFSRSHRDQREVMERILREARFHHVERLCVSALGDLAESPTPAQVREANDDVLSLMSQYREVVGFCYLNPRYPDEALQEIERCFAAGMAGIKLLISCKASDPLVCPIAARAAELRAPILQHAWYKRQGQMESESTPADVAVLAARHPATMIVMAHLTGAGERGIAEIAPYENLSVDTSGSEPEAGITEMAVRKLGGRRVVFGTDASGRGYGAALGKVYGARLPARVKALILGGNAARLLARRASGAPADNRPKPAAIPGGGGAGR